MYIFGGSSKDPGDKLNDLWIFNIQSLKWTEVIVKSSINPMIRSGHCMVMDSNSNKILVFGGSGGTTATLEMNDLWSYNIFTEQWQQLHTS